MAQLTANSNKAVRVMETSSKPVSGVQVESRYWAFISYSHRDKAWGEWVQRSLEGYRVPRRLVGRETEYGRVPRRLMPVFRDEAELPTSGDLGQAIRNALEGSRTLIVVCSPNAVASRWVNEEILAFKSLLPGVRRHRVLCLIVAGEPNSDDKPDLHAKECFPLGVRFDVDSSGRLTDRRVEPIAADVRVGGSSRRDAKLRLVAGVAGVGFDELRQRDKRARLGRMIVGLAATCVLTALGVYGWRTLIRAERRVEVLQSVRAEEMNRALHEIRTKETYNPFPTMMGRYSMVDLDSLRRHLASASEIQRVINERYKVGSASVYDLARAEFDVSLLRAELAWAESDAGKCEKELTEAVGHARDVVECIEARLRAFGAAYDPAMSGANEALHRSESMLARLKQFRQAEGTKEK